MSPLRKGECAFVGMQELFILLRGSIRSIILFPESLPKVEELVRRYLHFLGPEEVHQLISALDGYVHVPGVNELRDFLRQKIQGEGV